MADRFEETFERFPRRVLAAIATRGLSEVFEPAAEADARAARIQASETQVRELKQQPAKLRQRVAAVEAKLAARG